jgi:polyisoprenoid-binding protein YceI
LTLRGVTNPVAFDAQLFRDQGTARDDLRKLRVTLNGTVNRSTYGATGFSDLVEDAVQIEIKAQIETAT